TDPGPAEPGKVPPRSAGRAGRERQPRALLVERDANVSPALFVAQRATKSAKDARVRRGARTLAFTHSSRPVAGFRLCPRSPSRRPLGCAAVDRSRAHPLLWLPLALALVALAAPGAAPA